MNFRTIFSLPFLFAILTSLFLAGCAELNDPYYDDRHYDRRYDRYDYDRYDRRYDDRYRWEKERERRRLEEERRRLEDERRRLEEQRRRERQKPSHSQSKPVDRCPSGWHPSERKCTDKERKKGCQDMRTPGGLGCVRGR